MTRSRSTAAGTSPSRRPVRVAGPAPSAAERPDPARRVVPSKATVWGDGDGEAGVQGAGRVLRAAQHPHAWPTARLSEGAGRLAGFHDEAGPGGERMKIKDTSRDDPVGSASPPRSGRPLPSLASKWSTCRAATAGRSPRRGGIRRPPPPKTLSPTWGPSRPLWTPQTGWPCCGACRRRRASRSVRRPRVGAAWAGPTTPRSSHMAPR
jgi:hypothetical protein